MTNSDTGASRKRGRINGTPAGMRPIEMKVPMASRPSSAQAPAKSYLLGRTENPIETLFYVRVCRMIFWRVDFEV